MSDFVFKGTRDYLHSTTVFDWIVSQFDGVPENVDFVFNRKTAMQCVLSASSSVNEGAVVGTWKDSHHDYKIVSTDESITERRPYDEDAIGRSCVFDARQVSIPPHVGDASFIERLVAGYKALLLRQEGLENAKLAFVRLRLKAIPSGPLIVIFQRKIGASFFQGEIRSTEGKVGEIYFGRWK